MILSLGNIDSVSEIEGRKHAILFLFLYIVLFPVSVSFLHESAFSRRPIRNLLRLSTTEKRRGEGNRERYD